MSDLTDAQVALVADWLVSVMKHPDMDTVEMAGAMGALFAAVMEMRKKTAKGRVLLDAFKERAAA